MTGSRRISDEMAAIFDPDYEPPVQVAICVVCRRELVAKEAKYRQIGSAGIWFTASDASVPGDPPVPLSWWMRSARVARSALRLVPSRLGTRLRPRTAGASQRLPECPVAEVEPRGAPVRDALSLVLAAIAPVEARRRSHHPD